MSPTASTIDTDAERRFAQDVLRHESAAVAALADSIGPAFHEAVGLIVSSADAGGSVIVTGLGKSGLVGAKLSATLASLGIPSHTVHPTEAAHGDLGRFRRHDLVICLSHSGATDEVVNLAALLHQDGLKIISITNGGDTPSNLEQLADVRLHLRVPGEAGDGSFVAPTSSTTATMALGDALALAAARRRDFTPQDFAKRHPGGALGGLLRPVTELLRFKVEDGMPLINENTSVSEALKEAAQSGRRPGALLVINERGRLIGIFTDGDLRRLVIRDPVELSRPIREVMTPEPRFLPHTALARDAVRAFREHRQDEFPVADGSGCPIGLLDVQDLIAMKLVEG